MLSFSSIFNDTRNFIMNTLAVILTTVVILSVISELIRFYLLPDINSLDLIIELKETVLQQHGEFSPELLTQTIMGLSELEQQRLMSILYSFIIKFMAVMVSTHLIVTGVIISLIHAMTYQQVSFHHLGNHFIKTVPMILFYMLLAIPGVIVLTILSSILAALSIPITMLAILFYLFIYIIFLTILIEPSSSYSFFAKLRLTLKFLKREIRLIVPIMIIWIVVAFFLLLMRENLFTQNNMIINFLFNILSTFLFVVVICYLYRLYSLSRQALPYDA